MSSQIEVYGVKYKTPQKPDIIDNSELDQEDQKFYKTEAPEIFEELEFDDSIWSQIELDPKFNQAKELFEKISSYSPVPYMESERKFLIMHLCNLSQD